MRLRGVLLATSTLSTAVLGLMGVGWAAMTPPPPSGATIGPPVTVSPREPTEPTGSTRPRERIGTAVDDQKVSGADGERDEEADEATTTSPETVAPTLVRPAEDDDEEKASAEGDGERHDDD